MKEIRIALVGIGNCASSLCQGIGFYRRAVCLGNPVVGLAHPTICGFGPGDIRVVAAIDVDSRKVGLNLKDAIFAPPNNTIRFFDDFETDVSVSMGNVLDGISAHMLSYPEHMSFRVDSRASASQRDICSLPKTAARKFS